MTESQCPTPPPFRPTPAPVFPTNIGAALAELARIGRCLGEQGIIALDRSGANFPRLNLAPLDIDPTPLGLGLGFGIGRSAVAAAAAAQQAAAERAAMWPAPELHWSAVIARIDHRSPERVVLHHDGRSPVRAHGPTMACPLWYDVDDPERAGRRAPAGRVFSARVAPHPGGLAVFAEGTMPHSSPVAAALWRHGTLAARADVSGAVDLEPGDDGLMVMRLRRWRLCSVEVFPPAVPPGVCRIWLTGEAAHREAAHREAVATAAASAAAQTSHLWAAPPDPHLHPHDLGEEPSVHVARLDGTAVCDGRLRLDRAAPTALTEVRLLDRCRRPACRRRYQTADFEDTDQTTRGNR